MYIYILARCFCLSIAFCRQMFLRDLIPDIDTFSLQLI